MSVKAFSVRALLSMGSVVLLLSCTGEMSSSESTGVTRLTVRSSEGVVLDGSRLFGDGGPTTTKHWEQLGGPPVPIDDPTVNVLRFIAPDVAEPTYIWISLTAYHSEGSARVLFTITVLPVSLSCGDGTCDETEDCASCSSDCGSCDSSGCGDSICGAEESCSACPQDCGACSDPCGDGICGAEESCSACSQDCGPCGASCGDGTCDMGESCTDCSADCGECAVGPAACLERPNVMVLDETYTDSVEIPSAPAGLAIDARRGLSLTTGGKALEIGESDLAEDLCIVGWTTIGQQSRDLIWRVMHDDIGGSAIRIYGSNYVIDGMRAENVQDAFDPRQGDGFELRNAWMQYVRDDCIENDERMAGRVVDSLFDGCYTFFSEQEDGDVAGETLLFERILVRLQPMPGPYGTTDPSILGHGSFFKKFDNGGRHEPIIRDSIFFLETECHDGCDDWPPGTMAENVTLVWTGSGEFPMSVLPGMTLTTDRSVWDDAVSRWKDRHGCTTMDQPCTRLHEPDPH